MAKTPLGWGGTILLVPWLPDAGWAGVLQAVKNVPTVGVILAPHQQCFAHPALVTLLDTIEKDR